MPIVSRRFRNVAAAALFVSALGAAACSREIPSSRLRERRGLRFLEGDEKPFSGEVARRDPRGGLRSRASFRDGKLHGISRSWHENGRLEGESHFAAGMLHGPQLRWHSSGCIRLQGSFANGVMEGAWRSWDGKGTLRQEREYLRGVAHGAWKEWSETGRLRSLHRFQRGAWAGLQSEWHGNGILRFQATARGETCDGSWRKWHPDGKPRLFGLWRNGVREGEWREWDDRGSLVELTRYAGGDLVWWRKWHPDGSPRLRARRGAPGGRWEWRAWRRDGREEMRRDTPLLRGLYPMFFTRPEVHAPRTLTAAQRGSLETFRQLSPYPLYSMTTRGEGEFTSFLVSGWPGSWTGLPSRNDLRRNEPELCSTFMARHRRGGAVFAHNNDHRPYPVLVLRHIPAGGYASISVVNLPSMNDVSPNPRLAGLQGRASFLRAPFYPQEGMNERGVAVSGMSSPGQERVIDPRRATLDYEQAMRLVLDHAADVDEALLLLESCNLAPSHQQHLLVADASGRSVVVEYFGDRLVAIPNDREWQVATNFPLHGRSLRRRRSECRRYDQAWDRLSRSPGGIFPAEAMDVLRAVSMTDPLETVTSTVYDLTRGDVLLALGRDYTRTWSFHLQPQGRYRLD